MEIKRKETSLCFQYFAVSFQQQEKDCSSKLGLHNTRAPWDPDVDECILRLHTTPNVSSTLFSELKIGLEK